MANKGTRIVIQGALLANLIDELLHWESLAEEVSQFTNTNWKRSPIKRENRRQAVVYGNCLETVKAYLGRRKVVALMDEARKTRQK